jgi:hypothetical protein
MQQRVSPLSPQSLQARSPILLLPLLVPRSRTTRHLPTSLPRTVTLCMLVSAGPLDGKRFGWYKDDV